MSHISGYETFYEKPFFLPPLRMRADGEGMMDDWVQVTDIMCSRDTLGRLKLESWGFNGDDTTSFFGHNHEVH